LEEKINLFLPENQMTGPDIRRNSAKWQAIVAARQGIFGRITCPEVLTYAGRSQNRAEAVEHETAANVRDNAARHKEARVEA
jgi:hypothetical protein